MSKYKKVNNIRELLDALRSQVSRIEIDASGADLREATKTKEIVIEFKEKLESLTPETVEEFVQKIELKVRILKPTQEDKWVGAESYCLYKNVFFVIDTRQGILVGKGRDVSIPVAFTFCSDILNTYLSIEYLEKIKNALHSILKLTGIEE